MVSDFIKSFYVSAQHDEFNSILWFNFLWSCKKQWNLWWIYYEKFAFLATSWLVELWDYATCNLALLFVFGCYFWMWLIWMNLFSEGYLFMSRRFQSLKLNLSRRYVCPLLVAFNFHNSARWITCTVLENDILVFSCSHDKHWQHCRQFFPRCETQSSPSTRRSATSRKT